MRRIRLRDSPLKNWMELVAITSPSSVCSREKDLRLVTKTDQDSEISGGFGSWAAASTYFPS